MKVWKFLLCVEGIYKALGYRFEKEERQYFEEDHTKTLVYVKGNNRHTISVWYFDCGEILVTYCNSFKNNTYATKWFEG